jgi:hypothetical protein
MEKVKCANTLAAFILTFFITYQFNAQASSLLAAQPFIKIVKLFDYYSDTAFSSNNPRVLALYTLYKSNTLPDQLNRLVEDGETYLMYAVRAGDADAVRALLKLENLIVDTRSVNGQTALDIAIEMGNEEIAALLIDRNGIPSMPSFNDDEDDDAEGDESGDEEYGIDYSNMIESAESHQEESSEEEDADTLLSTSN